ncbi:MAG: DUF5722 domain-containing protein [Planctomycetota bacterium]
MKRFIARLLTVTVCLATNLFGQSIEKSPLKIDWPSEAQINQLNVEANKGTVSLQTTGNDPYVWLTIPPLPQNERHWIFSLESFCTTNIPNPCWYVGKPPRESGRVDLPTWNRSEGWSDYKFDITKTIPRLTQTQAATPIRFDLGSQSDVRIEVRNLVVRLENALEVEQRLRAKEIRDEKLRLQTQIQEYQTRSWQASIDNIAESNDELLISGSVASALADRELAIIHRRPEELSSSQPESTLLKSSSNVSVDNRGRFSTSIHADPGSPLRLPGVRWQLVSKAQNGIWELASAARYVDRFGWSEVRDLPKTPELRAAKGLTCLDHRFSIEQLSELGLRHGSINLTINNLVREKATNGFERSSVGGYELFFNSRRVRVIDSQVKRLRRAGITVAAIVLIPKDDPQRNSLIHPEFDRAGVYSMPNLTTRDSARLYALTMMFLAERYSRLDEPFGRIDHWIVHNEVDMGWHWTNMGEQPLHVFMDHYFRSLKMVDTAVRRYNPHAKVFVPLTHLWTVVAAKSWRGYPVRTVLDEMFTLSLLEGNFPWGVAFHPYPQSLWEADTWNDNQAVDSVDAKKITLKNIKVLDRYLREDHRREPGGDVRKVICSEQGFHSPAEKPESLEIQNAALLYAFKQMRDCPSIIAFDYHRPVDHPNEGGLRLGLRGLPSPGNPIGEAKPAWSIFKDIGTEREAVRLEAYQHLWSN